jgi:hypothetical protein
MVMSPSASSNGTISAFLGSDGIARPGKTGCTLSTGIAQKRRLCRSAMRREALDLGAGGLQRSAPERPRRPFAPRLTCDRPQASRSPSTDGRGPCTMPRPLPNSRPSVRHHIRRSRPFSTVVAPSPTTPLLEVTTVAAATTSPSQPPPLHRSAHIRDSTTSLLSPTPPRRLPTNQAVANGPAASAASRRRGQASHSSSS